LNSIVATTTTTTTTAAGSASPTATTTISARSIVLGNNTRGDTVQGRLVNDVTLGGDVDDVVFIEVEYEGNQDEESPLNCRVGGLVVDDSGSHEGCFANTGSITILDLLTIGSPTYECDYEYDVNEDNVNGLTLQKFSEQAEGEMWKCGDNCPYEDYAKFVRYYQHFDYADAWIQKSFDGGVTDFKLGNADFSHLEQSARAESVRVTTKVMNVWMYVVRMMEHALDQCDLGCDGGRDHRCDDSPVRAWDQAVAFYVGSLEGEDGAGQGLLLYDLADQMCAQFRTCGEDGTEHTGTSYVNNHIMKQFGEGQMYMMRRHCGAGRRVKESIVKLMTVPLIQSTMQMAYKQDFFAAETDEEAAIVNAKGAATAASVLPLVHDCYENHAATIYRQMKIKTNNNYEVDFRAVQTALEQSYTCLGVSCDMVGGYWQHTHNDYAFEAAPCRGVEDVMETTPTAGILLLVIVGVIVVFCATLVFLYLRRDRREDVIIVDNHHHHAEFGPPQINIGVSFD